MEKTCPYIQSPCIKDQCLMWKGGKCPLFAAVGDLPSLPDSRLSIVEKKRQANVERLNRVKKKYPRAYTSWTSQEDDDLKNQYQNGARLAELPISFQRQPSAIMSRLRKLGLLSDAPTDKLDEISQENGDPTSYMPLFKGLSYDFTPRDLPLLLGAIKEALIQIELGESKKKHQRFTEILRSMLKTAGFNVYEEYPVQYFNFRHHDGFISLRRGKIFLYATHPVTQFRLAIELREGAYVKYRSFEKILQCDADCGIILARGSIQPEYIKNNLARFTEVLGNVSKHLLAFQDTFKLGSKQLWFGVQKIRYWEPLLFDLLPKPV